MFETMVNTTEKKRTDISNCFKKSSQAHKHEKHLHPNLYMKKAATAAPIPTNTGAPVLIGTAAALEVPVAPAAVDAAFAPLPAVVAFNFSSPAVKINSYVVIICPLPPGYVSVSCTASSGIADMVQ